MEQGIDIVQHVLLFAVESDGAEIRADIYGGGDGICGTVIYRFEDEATLRTKEDLLRLWCDEGTPLTYVSRSGHVALLDEMAMLADAFEG